MDDAATFSKRWWIFSAVAVGIFMSTLDGSIVNLALPTIMADLQAPLSVVEWVMMIYLITVSSLLLSFGRLSDFQGRRWVYIRGLIVFSAGSALCALAGTAAGLIASRCFQGLGAAMIMACTPAIVVETFPPSERGKALGMVGAVVASGLTVGPALGGWILQISSWQTLFYINIPIGIGAAIGAHRLLKGTRADVCRQGTFDYPGAVLLVICIGSLALLITHGRHWGYASIKGGGLSLVFLAAVCALAWQENRAIHPLAAPSLLKIRLFVMPVLAAMILFAGLFTIIFLMPFFLIHPCGYSPRETGYIMITPFVCLFLIAPPAGALSDRIGSQMLCTLGMGILTVSLITMTGLSPGMSKLSIIWRMALAGAGVAVFTPPNNVTAMSSVPQEYMGLAAGTVAAVRNLGMVLGIAVAGAVFDHVFSVLSGGMSLKIYHPEMVDFFMPAFHLAMLAGAIFSGIGVIVTFLRGADVKCGDGND
jgi:EmrB/QacA subfamily drug resistance transporter